MTLDFNFRNEIYICFLFFSHLGGEDNPHDSLFAHADKINHLRRSKMDLNLVLQFEYVTHFSNHKI